ncbi:chloride channel protein [Atopobiaceae bacterium 24-176]
MGQRVTAAATWTRRSLEAYDWVMGARRVAFAVVCGILCGLANVVLCLGVSWAGDAWRALPWLSALLPALAALEVVMYRRLGVVMDLRPGFNGLMKDMGANRRLPTRVGPTMLAGTLMSLLGGASVGPDSAAKHLGASVGAAMVPWFSVDDDNGEPAWDWAVACGLSACFSALLCAPLGVFAYLVERLKAHGTKVRHLPTVLLSCIVAAAFARPLRLQLSTPPVGLRLPESADLWGAVAVALAAAVAGSCFIAGIHGMERLRARLGTSPLRCLVIGGAVVAAALVAVPGLREWGGLETDLVRPALAGGYAGWGFAAKLALTVVCLGFGLRGGEVTPMFVIGALMGSTVAAAVGADPLVTGALAMVALYAVALESPVSGVLVGCEFFGWGFAPWLVPTIALAWLGRAAVKAVASRARQS